MIDVAKIRKDFPMYSKGGLYRGLPLTYLDNAATTFKPEAVLEAQDSYYRSFTANAHRGDYSLAHDVDVAYEGARKTVAAFLHADPDEVCFTSGDTMGLNEVAFGLEKFLKKGDEILLSEGEHASNVLPWFVLARRKGLVIRYIPLHDGRITVEGLRSVLSERTKVVSIARVGNVLGYVSDVRSLCALAHQYGALFVEDGAQSVAHLPSDVKDTDVDFLVFSGHKMCGPLGIGVLYGKRDLLERMDPLLYGGEMNARFYEDGSWTYSDVPLKFEAGTQNIAGALGLAAACRYLSELGLEQIAEHERTLRRLAVEKLRRLSNVVLYNEDGDTGIVTFNVKDVFAQDVASYLSSKGVFVRSGQHCAKLLPPLLSCQATVRASFYFYNDEADVDRLVDGCAHAEDFLDVFFA